MASNNENGIGHLRAPWLMMMMMMIQQTNQQVTKDDFLQLDLNGNSKPAD